MYVTHSTNHKRFRATKLAVTLVLTLPGFAYAAPSECVTPPSLSKELNVRPDAATYAELGAWFAREDQATCAAEAFSKALQKQPESAHYAYMFGLSLFTAGELNQAIAPLQQSLRLDPTSVDSHLVFGSVLEQLGRRPEAELQWGLSLNLDPKSSAALENLSRDLLIDGNYLAVIELLQPRETANSSQLSSAAAVNLSVAYTKSGLLDNSSDVLVAALRASPTSVPVIQALSAVLVLQGQYHDALDILSVAVKSYPKNTQLQIRYLHALVLARDTAAEPLCARLLKVDPSQWELLYLMGLLRMQSGDVKGARTWLERSVKQNPAYADSRFQLGLALASLNDEMAAKEQLEKAIALGFRDPQAHYALGRAFRSLGQNKAAQQQFQLYQCGQLVELNKTRAAMESYQADKARADGNFSQAAVDYRQALSLDPTEPLLAYRLAMALDKTGDLTGERAALEQAVNNNPHMAAAQNQLGYLDFSAGNAESAIQHFQFATEADAGYTQAWMNLAAALCLEYKWEDARAALAHVLQIDPSNPQANELLQRLNSIEPPH